MPRRADAVAAARLQAIRAGEDALLDEDEFRARADARGSRVLHDAAFDRVVYLAESPTEPTALPRRLMTDQDTTAPEALPSGVSGDPNAEEKKRCPARPMTTTCIPGSSR